MTETTSDEPLVLLPRPGNMDQLNTELRRVLRRMTTRRLKQQNSPPCLKPTDKANERSER